MHSLRGQGCSLIRSVGAQDRFDGEGDGMNDGAQGRVEQVRANCERSSGVVGLCTIQQRVAGLPG
ncbi:hypothetical protein C9382_16275 [Pseudomonas aylmerensis]|uniref:Uncharacterized protein n=1 Tax=Pseudomonas aylmerensis TaxID=1869229 RepID=A0A2T4FWF9_9PSED|nr:hypothetical protein DXV65_18645 [Pseudomonas fluorescens]PTC27762.1 hypothetical protein C9382_16275 [Pseudomonas aylmerensis]